MVFSDKTKEIEENHYARYTNTSNIEDLGALSIFFTDKTELQINRECYRTKETFSKRKTLWSLIMSINRISIMLCDVAHYNHLNVIFIVPYSLQTSIHAYRHLLL